MSSALPSGPLGIGSHQALVGATGEGCGDVPSQHQSPAPARPFTEEKFEYSGKVNQDDPGTDLYSQWTSQATQEGVENESIYLDGGVSNVIGTFGDNVTEDTLQYLEEHAEDHIETLLMPGAGLDLRWAEDRVTEPSEYYNISPAQSHNLTHLGGDFHIPSQVGVESVPELTKRHSAKNNLPSPGTLVKQPVEAPEELKEEETDKPFAPISFRMVALFALPALGAVLTDPLMSLVDTACVGQISSLGLAALGPNTTIFGFVSMIFQFLTTATTAMVARAFDRGEKKEAGKAVSDGLLLATVFGIMSCGGLLAGSSQIFALLNTSSELLVPATSYLFWRALALPCTLISLVGAAASLGQRDAATPLKVAALSGLVNLVVDLYLVLGPPQMGITGAAIATAGSQLMAAILYVRHLRKTLPLSFRIPYWNRVKPFITAGSVLTLRSVCLMTALSLMTVKAASMGTVSIATHQVVVGVLTLMQFCPEPISQAAQTFLASTAAALRKGTSTPDEKVFARATGQLLMKTSAGVGLALATFSALVVKFIPHIFTSDAVVMATVSNLAPQLFITVFVYAVVNVMDGLVFASADMKYAAGIQVFNLPFMFLFLGISESMGMGLSGIWFAMVAFTSLRFVENASRIFKQYA
eukprot:CAMPEP_0196600256 /NCGR_PEP_ID=MMETSP1081-20130531/95282_1 /TAXON_ID=36882 /ORGANISM="Pyramimonas amylifera, Strain CCMP720" /LENGTH=640 /DNA_ID=CAMNT_0041926079 /DNA_START=652 /DNA_END=2574 /DNA_ORIENTATION=-